MSAAHTPGPWFVDPAYPLSVMAPDGNDAPWLVANAMPDAGGIDEEQGEANARLIATAPELLAALERSAMALTGASKALWKAKQYDAANLLSDVAEQARAALLAAKGGA